MNSVSIYRGFIVLTLLAVFISAPLAHAQFSGGGDENSLTSLVQRNAGGILSTALSCNKKVQGYLSRFSSFGKSTGSGGGSFEAVRVMDSSVAQSSADTATATEASQFKETCKNAIEKAAAQALLRELTFRTVNWINNGFQGGGSIFIPDTSSFLRDMRDQQVQTFASIIGFDPENFPFGRQFAQQLLLSSRSYFEQDMRYSLSKLVPGGNTYRFYNNFSIGGWGAFLALSYPNNNPFGFQLAAQDEIGRRIADTGYSYAQDLKDQLQRNAGFLDLKECADPNWDAEAYAAEVEAAPEEDQWRVARENDCPQWETKTPGSIAGGQLAKVLGAPIDQLIDGKDLAASLTSVFNALTVQLINKGLSSLESDEDYTSGLEDSFGFNYASTIINGGQGLGSSGGGDQWWRQEEFKLLSEDPTNGIQVLVEQERQYIEVLQTSGGLGHAQFLQRRLIPAVYQLDLCIPGPNPDWQDVAQNRLQAFYDFSPKSADDVLGGGAGIVSSILGFGNGFDQTIRRASDDSRNKRLYAQVVANTLGIKVAVDENVNGYGRLIFIFDKLFERYRDIITERYNLTNLPSMADISAVYFRRIPEFQQGIIDAQEQELEARLLLQQLSKLYVLVQELNTKYPTEPDPNDEAATAEYDELYDRIERTFLRLAPDIHTKSDILAQKDLFGEYQDYYDEIAGTQFRRGLIRECLDETLDPDYEYRTVRVGYPQDLLGPTTEFVDARLATLHTAGEWPRSFLVEFRNNQGVVMEPFFSYGYGILPKPDGNPAPGLLPVGGLFEFGDIGPPLDNGKCGTYYDPLSVRYGTNFFGRPRFREGNGINPVASCTEGLESLLGVY